jgi:hypothetical protein
VSQRFYLAVIALLTLFGGFMTWLHYREIALIDGMLKCLVTAGIWA